MQWPEGFGPPLLKTLLASFTSFATFASLAAFLRLVWQLVATLVHSQVSAFVMLPLSANGAMVGETANVGLVLRALLGLASSASLLASPSCASVIGPQGCLEWPFAIPIWPALFWRSLEEPGVFVVTVFSGIARQD